MARIQHVAGLAGVSTATVSRALSGKPSVSPATRARVEAAARQLGYVVSASASSLASGKTRNVGVVMPFIDSWFFSSVLKGTQHALEEAGYDLTLYHLDPNVGTENPTTAHPRRRRLFDEFLRRGRVDALIAISLELDQAELDSLTALRKPVVGLGGPLPGLHTLSIDDEEIARLAVEHLLALGHTRIAHLAGSQDFELDFLLPANRRAGWEAALREAGLEVDPLLLRTADFTIPSGYESTLQLLGDPRVKPTAIFAASDEMAIGALLAARDLGRNVPGDLSIIGIDGHALSDFFGLTTVDQFPEVQGRRAVDVLLHQIDGNHPEPGNEELPYELVVRRSTGPPPPGRPEVS